MIKNLSLRKGIIVLIVSYVFVFSIIFRIDFGSGYLSEMSLAEQVDFIFEWNAWAPLFTVLLLGYPVWIGILFVFYEKRSMNNKLIYLIKHISYIVPTLILAEFVVTIVFAYITPHTPVLSELLDGSWIIFADVLVSFIISVLWIGVLLILRLFFKTDWIVILLSMVLFYFHSLIDSQVILPLLSKLFSELPIMSEAVLLNHLGLNVSLSIWECFILFIRLTVMVLIYYSLYLILKKWKEQ